jgi:hypothetical protein
LEVLNRELRDQVRKLKEQCSGADACSKEKRHLEKKMGSTQVKLKEMKNRGNEYTLIYGNYC